MSVFTALHTSSLFYVEVNRNTETAKWDLLQNRHRFHLVNDQSFECPGILFRDSVRGQSRRISEDDFSRRVWMLVERHGRCAEGIKTGQ